MIRQIFLDVDDVLCTMAPHMLRMSGCPVAGDDYSIWPSDLAFEIEIVASRMLGKEIGWADFWNNLTEQAWVSIPKTPFANWLIDICAQIVGRRNVYLATAPTDTPCCASGKMIWIQKNLPDWLHHQFVITPCKYLLGNPESLLIDDFPVNIRHFRKRKGHAITVPRPWNSLRDKLHIPHIGQQLLRLTNEHSANLNLPR